MGFIGGMLIGALICSFLFVVSLCLWDFDNDIYEPKHFKDDKNDKE